MFCLLCLSPHPGPEPTCPSCGQPLVDFEPPPSLLQEIEKRRFLLRAMERWVREEQITPVLEAQLAQPFREQLEGLGETARSIYHIRVQGEAPPPAEAEAEAEPPLEPPTEAKEDQDAPRARDMDALGEASNLVEGADPLSLVSLLETAEEDEPEDRAVMAESTWSRYLRPFLAQNWLYFIGAFLVLSSGFYLVSMAWTSMSSLWRQGVIWMGLLAVTHAFSATGAFLLRRFDLEQAGRIFFLISAGLLGTTALAAGYPSAGLPLALTLLALTILSSPLLMRALKSLDPAGPRHITLAGLMSLLPLAGLLPLLQVSGANPHLALVLPYTAALALALALRRLPPAFPSPLTAWQWTLFAGPLIYIFLLTLAWAILWIASTPEGPALHPWLGPLAGLMGIICHQLARARMAEARLSAWLAIALALATLGVAMANPLTLPLALALLTLLLLHAAPAWPPLAFPFALAGALTAWAILRLLLPSSLPLNGLLALPYLLLIVVLERRFQPSPQATSLRWFTLLATLAAFALLLLDSTRSLLLLGGPALTLGTLSACALYRSRPLGYMGLAITLIWIGRALYGLPEACCLIIISLALLALACSLLSRRLPTPLNDLLRETPLIILAAQILLVAIHLTAGRLSLLWALACVLLLLQSALLAQTARTTAYPWLTHIALALALTSAGLLAKAIPPLMGWPVRPWLPPFVFVAMAGLFLELSLRLRAGLPPLSGRLGLFGLPPSPATAQSVWNAPLQVWSYILALTATAASLLLPPPHPLPLAMAGLLALYLARAGLTQQRAIFGYLMVATLGLALAFIIKGLILQGLAPEAAGALVLPAGILALTTMLTLLKTPFVREGSSWLPLYAPAANLAPYLAMMLLIAMAILSLTQLEGPEPAVTMALLVAWPLTTLSFYTLASLFRSPWAISAAVVSLAATLIWALVPLLSPLEITVCAMALMALVHGLAGIPLLGRLSSQRRVLGLWSFYDPHFLAEGSLLWDRAHRRAAAVLTLVSLVALLGLWWLTPSPLAMAALAMASAVLLREARLSEPAPWAPLGCALGGMTVLLTMVTLLGQRILLPWCLGALAAALAYQAVLVRLRGQKGLWAIVRCAVVRCFWAATLLGAALALIELADHWPGRFFLPLVAAIPLVAHHIQLRERSSLILATLLSIIGAHQGALMLLGGTWDAWLPALYMVVALGLLASEGAMSWSGQGGLVHRTLEGATSMLLLLGLPLWILLCPLGLVAVHKGDLPFLRASLLWSAPFLVGVGALHALAYLRSTRAIREVIWMLAWAVWPLGLTVLFRLGGLDLDPFMLYGLLAMAVSLRVSGESGLCRWVLALGLIALAGVTLHSPLQWTMTCLLVGLAWLGVTRRLPPSVIWLMGTAIAALLALHSVAVLLMEGTLEPHSFHLLPALALLAGLMVALALLMEQAPQAVARIIPIEDKIDGAALGLSLLPFPLLLLALTQPAHGLNGITFLACLALLTWRWMGLAVARQREYLVYLGLACFFGTYVYIRLMVGWGSPRQDVWVMVLLGFLLAMLNRLWERAGGDLLRRAFHRVSLTLPLASLLLALAAPDPLPLGLWLIYGLFYGLTAFQRGLRYLYIPALILVNVEIFLLWRARDITDPQWYALPLGFTLFALSVLFKEQLRPKSRNTLRILGCLAIYLSGMAQVVTFHHISDIILAALLAIAGVVVGIALRIRSYLYLGSAFLVLNMAINLFRLGLSDRLVGMVFLFTAGLILLGAAVFFNLKREELLRRVREVRSQLSGWE